MAGDWIKMRTDLRDDPAVIYMAAELGIDEDTVVGKLHRLWSWADKQTVDGNAFGVTETWIDRYLGVTGFALSLVNVGWLSLLEDGLEIPNFERHNGESAKRRALTARRVARYKVTHGALPREEKRREDIKPPIVPQGTTDRSGQSDSSPRGLVSKPKKKRTRSKIEYDPAFERWWAVYPKKAGKEAAQREWLQARQRLAIRHPDWTDDQIRCHLGKQALAYSNSHLGQHFPLDPERWLKRGRFDDDPSAWEELRGSGTHEPVDVPYQEH
jgi:hypothetical protein